jgi:copper oxidase (laccase) domain-containing protein
MHRIVSPRRVAAASALTLCASCTPNLHRDRRPAAHAGRTVTSSLVVRTTLATVSRLDRPVRWALAMHPRPPSIQRVVFSIDGRVVATTRAAPYACCPGRHSYLAGLSPGSHTFVCTVFTTDRHASRETVTAIVVPPRPHPHPHPGETS